jgi:hypothetical protein
MVMPALTPRATPVRADDTALLHVLKAYIETLKAENEILKRRLWAESDRWPNGRNGRDTRRRRAAPEEGLVSVLCGSSERALSMEAAAQP